MKAWNSILNKGLLFLMLGVLIVNTSSTQNAKKNRQKEIATSIESLLNSKNYVFKAQTVLPTRGSVRQLTSEYDLRVLGDSIVAYLPYFGRAYTAPVDPTAGGIQFTSTNFDYNIEQKKK